MSVKVITKRKKTCMLNREEFVAYMTALWQRAHAIKQARLDMENSEEKEKEDSD